METRKNEISLPKVIIAGRPNVGKSTLFNRFVGRRRAITDPFPGVTRDAVRERCVLNDIPFYLFDTGGYKTDGEGDFDDIVSRKSVETTSDADIILFLLDVTELTGEDRSFAEILRRSADKVIVVVNKVDSEERDSGVWEYYSLGFDTVVGVSSSHGRNMDVLKEILTERLEALPRPEPVLDETEPPLILALLGKPNVGKSTLANALTGTARSLVSDIPGTTRDVVQEDFRYKGRRIRILDTAGIRKKSKVREDVEYYSVNRAFKAISDADVILLMADVRDNISDQDKKIADQIVKTGKGVVIVLNKWDLTGGGRNEIKDAVEEVRYRFPVLSFAPVATLSAQNDRQFGKLLDTVLDTEKQLKTRIDTGELNRALHDWVVFTPPPMAAGGRPFKVRYITQVSAAPVKFILFVNRKTGFPDSYLRFIANNIRKYFGFSSVPVDIEIRERSRNG